MNHTFNFFKSLYPEKTKFRDLTATELQFIDTHFPEKDFYLFLAEEGFCSFGNGFFQFVNPIDYQPILPKITNTLGEHLVFCRTAFGDLFTWDGSKIYVLHVHLNQFSHISNNMFDFFTFCLGDEKYVSKNLYKSLFSNAVNTLGMPKPEECFAFRKNLRRGGKQDLKNIRLVNLQDFLNSIEESTE